jgi:ankyrin repeat protein
LGKELLKLFYRKEIMAECHHDILDELDILDECKNDCRSSIIRQYIELYPQSLSIADEAGYLPLHLLLWNEYSTIEDALMMIETYPAALQHQDNYHTLPIHIECNKKFRLTIIHKCIELYPESLKILDHWGNMPLHKLLRNDDDKLPSHDAALLMMEKYPAALEYRDHQGYLPILMECVYRHRSIIISKCIELYPESLSTADPEGYLPLHRLLQNVSSPSDAVLIMIEKYPAALRHRNDYGELPLHIECRHQCRSSIIRQFIELYPESLSIADEANDLPLHLLLWNEASSGDDAFIMIYPAALQHQDRYGYLPIHIECIHQRRSSIISRCIELYPESLEVAIEAGDLPLHLLLVGISSSIDVELMMIEKYQAALQRRNNMGNLPIHIECSNRCRSTFILKCIELYPESLDDRVIISILNKINKFYFSEFMMTSLLLIVVTVRPLSLYEHYPGINNDIRTDPHHRRRILNLLPHHVFTPTHDNDHRDLNWLPRAEVIMLLSQIKIQPRK